MRVLPGRYTADIDGDFVVFLLGMRLNRPLRGWRWLPAASAMPALLRVLDGASRGRMPRSRAMAVSDDVVRLSHREGMVPRHADTQM